MTFLIDVQLPPRLKQWFAKQGEQALHAGDLVDGLRLPDSAIWNMAKENSWVIMTKDTDFLDMSLLQGKPPVILLIRYGNCSTEELLENMIIAWAQVKDALSKKDVRLVALYKNRVEIYKDKN